MQGREDDLEGRLPLEFGMGVDGNAAAVVADGDGLIVRDLELDPARVSRHRFVHGVVQELGGQVMHGVDVGAADVHGGTLAHRLQAFQDLDVPGLVTARRLLGGGLEQIGGFTHARLPAGFSTNVGVVVAGHDTVSKIVRITTSCGQTGL